MIRIKTQKEHSTSAILLITLASLCLVLSFVGLFVPAFLAALFFGILTMIFGNYAFEHFKKAASAPPPPALRSMGSTGRFALAALASPVEPDVPSRRLLCPVAAVQR